MAFYCRTCHILTVSNNRKKEKMRIKRIIVGALVLFQLMSSCALQKTYQTETGLQGKVESRTSFIYSYVIDEKSGKTVPVSNEVPYSVTCFNQDGLLVQVIKYDSDDNIRSLKLYEYDDNDNKTEEREYYNSGNIRFKSTYSYSNEGRDVEVKYWNYQHNGDYVSNVKTLKYNNNHDLIEFNHTRKKIIYKYDNQNNLVEELSYRPDGNLFSKITYTYDKQGIVNEMIVDNSEDTFRNGRTLFKHNNQGDFIEIIRYDADGKLGIKTTKTIEYDMQGNRIKSTDFQDGVLKYESVMEYKYFD